MLAILLLPQLASAASAPPAATPAPALGVASTAVSAKPKTLADLAQERKLGKKGVSGGTLSVSGVSGLPAVVSGSEIRLGSPASPEGNARLRSAEAEVQTARRAVDDAAVRKGMTSEDAATARRKLDDARRELNREREATARQDR